MRPLRAALVPALVALLLSGCATPRAASPSACLPLAPISAADQKALAAQLASLPADSPAMRAVEDWIRMRDADRACLAAKP